MSDITFADGDALALRDAVHGAVLTPLDGGYEDARRVHNTAVDQRPGALVQVTGAADIAAVLRFSRERGMSVSVRGGGHGVAGHAVRGDVVVDLSAFRGVRIDADRATGTVRGGTTWGEVDAATQVYGLAVPGARISHTGVAGHTLGGGEGWLSPRHGLSSDNLLAAELVTADGRVVTASADEEPELFWALRGGGGNFGVVTSFTFRLHPIEPLVFGGLLLYRLADAQAVIGVLNDLYAAGHDEFAAGAVFVTAPPLPFVPGHVVGRPVVVVVPAWLGAPGRGTEVLRPLWERVRPLADATSPMPYVVLQTMLDQNAPPTLRHRWAGSFLPALPGALIESLVDAIATAPGPLSHISVAPLGGAVTRVPADATAFPHRDASWLVHTVACWPSAAADRSATAWVDALGTTIRGHGETGTYPNVDGCLDDARLRWAFGDDRYRRLQRIKAIWDPDDVFRHCDRIRPLESPGAWADGRGRPVAPGA